MNSTAAATKSTKFERSMAKLANKHFLRGIEEEATIASDNSSLGGKLQIPKEFLDSSSPQSQQRTSSSYFPAGANGYNSSSRLREEAKVHRLLAEAKRQQQQQLYQKQQTLVFRNPTHSVSYMEQQSSMSVTLPAGYQQKQQQHQQQQQSARPRININLPQSPSIVRRGRSRSVPQLIPTTPLIPEGPPAHAIFRGKKSSSSIAVGAMEQGTLPVSPRNSIESTSPSTTPTPTSSKNSPQTARGGSCGAENSKKQNRWRLRLPKLPTTKQSTLVHI